MRRAVDVYRQVIKAAPLYQEAYALGLQAAQRAEDVDGIRWATVGILKQAWPANQEAVRNAALRIGQGDARRAARPRATRRRSTPSRPSSTRRWSATAW